MITEGKSEEIGQVSLEGLYFGELKIVSLNLEQGRNEDPAIILIGVTFPNILCLITMKGLKDKKINIKVIYIYIYYI